AHCTGATAVRASEPVRPASAGLTELLSRPLPGTPERADADIARALERALGGFLGVDGASVIVSRAGGESRAARHAAVQLQLSEGCRPTATWIEGIAAFIHQALPDLDPAQLTVVDTTGRPLYAHGGPCVTASLPAGRVPSDAAPIPARNSAALSALLLVAAFGAAAAVAILLIAARRRARAAQPPRVEPGPFSFLEALEDAQLRRALAGERLEVLAVVVAGLTPAQAARVRELTAVRGQGRVEAVDAEVIHAVAEALRAKLVTS
ncbi:MAG: hypothetical protein AB7Y46_18085, partial [Armatimonadota bacterium]